MAHKKAAWSAKNLTTSRAKYRGVKLFGGQTTTAGNIIIRQKGDAYQLGHNVYKGRDFSIHAAIDGVVTFRKKNIKRFDGNVYLKTVVDVVTTEEYAAQQADAASGKTASAKAPKAVKTAGATADKSVKKAAPKAAAKTADDNVAAETEEADGEDKATAKKPAAKTAAKKPAADKPAADKPAKAAAPKTAKKKDA